MSILIAAAVIIGLYIILWIFAKPVRMILKIAFKGALGCGALLAVNAIFAPLGFFVGINPVTYLVCGFLGVSGFLALIGIQLII